MAQRLSKKVQRSNGVHLGLWRKYAKSKSYCPPLMKYHGEVVKRQRERNKVLSLAERRRLKKKLAPKC